MARSHYMVLLLLALGLGTASFFLHQSDYPLTYDEGDYLVAVHAGLWTNWTDADDISIVEFARMGFGAVKDPAARARLSDYIRSSGSTMFHRHYHPPLAFYPAIALQPAVQSLPLHWQLRLANLFWLLVWIAALALLGRRYTEARSPALILVPASAAWAMAVVGYNMHLPYGLLASLFFLCWYLYEEHRHAGLRRAAQFFLAASFATVEYGMFVLFFILLWGLLAFWKSGEKTLFLRRTLASAGWVLLFLAILWPAGVINLGLLKSWVFVIYIALFRLGGEPAAFQGWLNLVLEKWNANPVELLLLAVLLVAVLARWRALLRRGSLFAAAGFILALLYLQINPTLVYRWYLFPAFAVGFLLFGHVLRREDRGAHNGAMHPDQPEQGKHTCPGHEPWDQEGQKGHEPWDQEPWDQKRFSNPTVFIVFGVLLFIAAWVLVPEPDYSELKQLHRIVDTANPTHFTLPRSVLPQLRPYHPDATIVSYHDVAMSEMNLADSIPVWRANGLVIVPKTCDTGNIRPDAETKGYAIFSRQSRK